MINLGIHRVCDMFKTDGTFLTWTDLQAKGLQSKNFLLWYGLINALAIKWKQLSQTNSTLPFTTFDNTSYTLLLNSKKLSLSDITTKKLYNELISNIQETPTAQTRFNELYPELELEWNKIYSLPFQVAIDTRTGEFQYKLLNRIVFTNTKLSKFGKVESPSCTFCGIEDETPEHLFVSCHLSKQFWEEISHWLQLCNIHSVFYFSNPVNVQCLVF